jgi:cholesterol oxidase
MTATGRLDYDVLIIGSGFGGSVCAMRLTEKGYRVAVLEAGKRWPDAELPKTSWDVRKFLWAPDLGMYGIQRFEFLDDVTILCGSGVGGGSNVYANTLCVPPRKFFQAKEWSGITDWEDELAPYYDQAARMLGVTRVPYLDTDADRLLREIATEVGREDTYNKAPVGVYFGTPGVLVDDPYFGGEGPQRRGCISCGECMIGCRHGAKNKLSKNYLHLAEKHGAVVHALHQVSEVRPLTDGGYEVTARHPAFRGRFSKPLRYTAAEIIFSAHAFGTAKLLHHMRHEGHLSRLSDRLGKLARTNSEVLLCSVIPYGVWKNDPDRFISAPGSVAITSAIWPDEATCIEPVLYGVGSNLVAFLSTCRTQGARAHRARAWLGELIKRPLEVIAMGDPRHWSQRCVILVCMQTRDESIDLYWQHGVLHSRRDMQAPPPACIPCANDVLHRLAQKMGAREGGSWFEVANRNATAHFIGGVGIGETADMGVVDPFQRLFGHPGLHVVDGSVMAANPGVNPSLSIAALAERAMSFWPNKGESDLRPSLGSSYERIKPIRPNKPIVPPCAPGALRLPC